MTSASRNSISGTNTSKKVFRDRGKERKRERQREGASRALFVSAFVSMCVRVCHCVTYCFGWKLSLSASNQIVRAPVANADRCHQVVHLKHKWSDCWSLLENGEARLTVLPPTSLSFSPFISLFLSPPSFSEREWKLYCLYLFSSIISTLGWRCFNVLMWFRSIGRSAWSLPPCLIKGTCTDQVASPPWPPHKDVKTENTRMSFLFY